ncbi:MAG: hypothetical protein HYW63_04095 [Candidatus Levybacteria bacterium]|nr:hypothetical protein [Candidatus Levybacteria bacterium]
MRGTPEAPRPNPIPTYTDAQTQKPWTVEHVDIEADPQSVEGDVRTMLALAQSLTAESTRGNIPQILFRIPLVDRSPLEKPGDEPTRRLWELQLTYGNDGNLEVQASTGHQLQSFSVRASTAEKPAEISYFGHHPTGDLDDKRNPILALSQKKNHPLWIAYSKRVLQKLVAVATTSRVS